MKKRNLVWKEKSALTRHVPPTSLFQVDRSGSWRGLAFHSGLLHEMGNCMNLRNCPSSRCLCLFSKHRSLRSLIPSFCFHFSFFLISALSPLCRPVTKHETQLVKQGMLYELVVEQAKADKQIEEQVHPLCHRLFNCFYYFFTRLHVLRCGEFILDFIIMMTYGIYRKFCKFTGFQAL